MNGSALADGPAEVPLSPVSAVLGTFSRPGATFERLVRRPTWWLPLVLWVVAVFASSWFVTPKIDFDRSIRDIIARQAERTGREIPESQIRTILERTDRNPLTVSAKGAAGFAVAFFLVALLFWGAVRAFGSEARYPQLLAVWGHANLANAAGALFAIPVFLTLPEASVTQQAIGRTVKSNLGAFLPETTPAFLVSLASSIDLFTIAALALLVLGLERLPELPKGAAVGIPVAFWLVWVLGKAALAALFFG